MYGVHTLLAVMLFMWWLHQVWGCLSVGVLGEGGTARAQRCARQAVRSR
jgi:hypothetical protein